VTTSRVHRAARATGRTACAPGAGRRPLAQAPLTPGTTSARWYGEISAWFHLGGFRARLLVRADLAVRAVAVCFALVAAVAVSGADQRCGAIRVDDAALFDLQQAGVSAVCHLDAAGVEWTVGGARARLMATPRGAHQAAAAVRVGLAARPELDALHILGAIAGTEAQRQHQGQNCPHESPRSTCHNRTVIDKTRPFLHP